MNHRINDIAALDACVGKAPAAVNLKVIDHLDTYARRWLTEARLMFAAFGKADNFNITLGGDSVSFLQGDDPHCLLLPIAALDNQLAQPGDAFGGLFLIPGLGETLRINGRVKAVSAINIEIAVEECYLQCAKALIRSAFWQAQPNILDSENINDFIFQSRFLALATINENGAADVSPRGDPAGALIRPYENGLCYADRPGNRRADSLRNILAQPSMAAAILVPGIEYVAIVSGTATIVTDDNLRKQFTVENKTPHLVTHINQAKIILRESAALQRAKLWSSSISPPDLDPAAIFAAHVKLNKAGGLAAQIARKTLSPKLMKWGLKIDYKNNLY